MGGRFVRRSQTSLRERPRRSSESRSHFLIQYGFIRRRALRQVKRGVLESCAGESCFLMSSIPTVDAILIDWGTTNVRARSEEHTSELQSLMRISYAVFCLKKKKYHDNTQREAT